MVDYFQVLGIPRSANDAEIKEAYRRMAKRYHPDSNPNDPEAKRRMQQINEAKNTLFDPVRREEHRVLLGLRERVSAERIAKLRNESRFQSVPGDFTASSRRTSSYAHSAASERAQRYSRASRLWSRRPRSKWDRVWKNWLYAVIGILVLFVVGVTSYELTRPNVVPADPIKEIIKRYKDEAPSYADTATSEIDTMTVADDTLPRLKRHGDILFGLGEYRSAAKYYERFLQHDSTDEEVIRNLSYAYFERGRYAKSLDVLSRQMHGDSNLVVAYYNIGELFLREEKPFDARNAFQAAIKIGDHMRSEGREPPPFVNNARNELARLE